VPEKILWEALDKKYGDQAKSPEPDKLSSLIFYLMLYAERPAVARKAIRKMVGVESSEYFAGWNEIRVSTTREISDFLAECGVIRSWQAAEAIKSLLTRTWQTFDDVSLEISDKPDPDVLSYIEGIQWSQVRSYIKCLWGQKKRPPLEAHTLRILERVGVFAPKASRKEKTQLLKVLTAENPLHKHHLLVILGKTTCTDKKQRCPRCPLKVTCTFEPK
jgi:endonuclease III